MYYFIIENGIINGKSELNQSDIFTDDWFEIEVSEKIYNDYEPDKYIYLDGEVVLNPQWEEIQRRKAEERINNLTMTALDFINFLKQVGLTDQNIEDYLNANLAIKHQLQFCQNVYCGVAKALMPIQFSGITITAEMVEQAFRIKNGEGVA